ncbi:MAG: hypothetical protein WBL95_21295 [Microcoleus sp.]|jgi:hypothetical protein
MVLQLMNAVERFENNKAMPYSKFTLSKAVEDFHLTIIEGSRFLPENSPSHS